MSVYKGEELMSWLSPLSNTRALLACMTARQALLHRPISMSGCAGGTLSRHWLLLIANRVVTSSACSYNTPARPLPV